MPTDGESKFEKSTNREAATPPRRLRALHPRHWQFATDEVLARIIEAARIPADDPETLNHEARKSLGASFEAAAQSLITNWETSAPSLKRPETTSRSIRRADYRRPANYALSVFFDSLVAAYISAFDRRPGTSLDWINKRYSGPLIRFLGTCCAEVRCRLECPMEIGVPVDVAQAIRQALSPFWDLSQKSTPAALRKRIQRSHLLPTHAARRRLRRYLREGPTWPNKDQAPDL